MDVVIGLIIDKQSRILITQRSLDKSLGGLWEFPGGKVEVGERLEDALSREIEEEVGLRIINAHYFGRFSGEPTQKPSIILHVYYVNTWSGQPKCCENQIDITWVEVSQLARYPSPKANQAIINKLKDQYVE